MEEESVGLRDVEVGGRVRESEARADTQKPQPSVCKRRARGKVELLRMQHMPDKVELLRMQHMPDNSLLPQQLSLPLPHYRCRSPVPAYRPKGRHTRREG